MLLLTDRKPLDIPEIKTEDPDSTYAPASYTPTESDLKKFEGIWRSIRHMDVQRIARKENALFNNKIRAAVLDQNTAYFDARWNLTKTNRVLVTYGTDTLSYIKVAAPDLTVKSLTALTGTYYSEEADATYLVEIKNNEIIINNKPHPPYKLTPTFNDAFFSEDGNLFEFRRDKRERLFSYWLARGGQFMFPFVK
ncbi:MAG: hypothetical protein UZ12_BCD005002353 [Bacteroidetes bacterium OLB12]|nr:MAG: hypothetical protein UZ12_BCD005002353 [Bacteroidetes bacterium OLB12]